MSVIRAGKSRDCGVCYWCDFAICMYNGKKCKGKMRVRHYPKYKETVKSNKSAIRQIFKKNIGEEKNE